ncbi:aldose 1-epimerase [Rhodoferax sp.]|uniref:aldose 1-epimerase n=1 Tax=Rhodoferax sp. TaxID=50421 RepID=UPI0025EF9A71|nr:aldose 1-epimerase [Rhodoferax sp.]
MHDTPDLVWLHAGNTHLALAPAIGGAIAALYTLDQHSPLTDPPDAFHWLRPATAAALQARDPLRMASFPLVPWCNRIRDGQAQALGHRLALPNAGGKEHALHGLGWQAAWTVLDATASTVALEFTHPGGAWPWAFTARQQFHLTAQGLHCTLSLRNDGTAPMPAALGHHPYFPHRPGTRLRCTVQAMWESDADLLPLRLGQPDFLPALRQGMALDALDLDNNFTGWDRRFAITWPAQARQLTLEADAPLDYFVLFCPRGADHFCAEPVSNCTDWLNHGSGPEVGGSTLEAGATLACGFRLAWTDLGPPG